MIAWGLMAYYLFWTPCGSKFYSVMIYPLYAFTCRMLGKKAVPLLLREFIQQNPIFWTDVFLFFVTWPIIVYPHHCWDSFLSLWDMLINLKTVPKTVAPDVIVSVKDIEVPSVENENVPFYHGLKSEPYDKGDKSAIVIFIVIGVIVAVGCAITGTGGTGL
jgi:hypothetical protein